MTIQPPLRSMYLCKACGKVSPTKTGEGGDKGWDVSCYMNSVVVPIESLPLTDINNKEVETWLDIQARLH